MSDRGDTQSRESNGQEYELVVPAGHGRAFQARAGQYISIIDIEGRQVGDFVAFNAHDVTEYLHTAHTRVHWNHIYPRVGDDFLTNSYNPILGIVHDDVGRHDVARAICNPGRYLKHFGIANHRNCLDNFADVLEPYGIARYWMPMPVNVFQNTPVMPDGTFEVHEPLSKPGDRIVFRAYMDVICALSACPLDLLPTNGYRITDLKVAVTNRI